MNVKVRQGYAEGTHETWYLAVCMDCTPTLPQPFTTESQRNEWATSHIRATGHRVEFEVETRSTYVFVNLTSVERYEFELTCQLQARRQEDPRYWHVDPKQRAIFHDRWAKLAEIFRQ